ncbi:MAG: hypothetical protein LBH93_07755 [Chitinispirillales bacterium]|jgi:hypothetical protein|nr:hypothetical protein [Chitinispirillales bacterium]
MLIIFMLLCGIVIVFLAMLCLTLFRIEKSVKLTLLVAERTILRNYGKL